MKHNQALVFVGWTFLVFLLTIVVKVPLQSTGYFNFGDIGVVFAGLMLGRNQGFLASAIGSSLGDAVGGYWMFIPLTFTAKGLEGLICGMAKSKKNLEHWMLLVSAGMVMVAVYFLGETFFFPKIGYNGAKAELLVNFVQVIGGNIGGKILVRIYFYINKMNSGIYNK